MLSLLKVFCAYVGMRVCRRPESAPDMGADTTLGFWRLGAELGSCHHTAWHVDGGQAGAPKVPNLVQL